VADAGQLLGRRQAGGPEPTMATFLPVLVADGCGTTQPLAQALSMIACSIDLMPTASVLMLSVQAASQGAGQMRPVKSGSCWSSAGPRSPPSSCRGKPGHSSRE
jgi:hypothetical protein